MKHSGTMIAGGVLLGGIVLGYGGWRARFPELTDTIERGDLKRADEIAGELFEAGELGREIKVLAVLVAACLAGLVLTQTSS